jgi:hypothetical protein
MELLGPSGPYLFKKKVSSIKKVLYEIKNENLVHLYFIIT